jgi:hypothetical protein
MLDAMDLGADLGAMDISAKGAPHCHHASATQAATLKWA